MELPQHQRPDQTNMLTYLWEQFLPVRRLLYQTLVPSLSQLNFETSEPPQPKFDPVSDIPSLDGKVFFITGGTAGLGASAITSLAAHSPSHIFFTGRNKTAAEALIAQLRTSLPTAAITFLECDHANLKSVAAAAEQFLSISNRLDVLICNAGIMALPASTTSDGYEIQFQVNHLSHALLIKLLLPLMCKTATVPDADVRIINLASIGYQHAPRNGIDFDTLRSDQVNLGIPLFPGPKWSRYGQSKLANMLYARELARQYPQITSVSVHPGYIMTDLFAHVDFWTRFPAVLAAAGQFFDAGEGTHCQLWAATCPKQELKNGKYYEPGEKRGVETEPLTMTGRDDDLAVKLWDWTQQELKKYD